MDYMREFESLFAALGFFTIFILLLFLPLLIIYIIGAVNFYKKAGKDGWEAIIPFYNKWVLTEIAGLEWWWFLILIAPTITGILSIGNTAPLGLLASLFGHFCYFYNISKKLHKDTGFAVLTTLFKYIMIPLIGLSNNYQFDNTVKVSNMGPFDSTNNSNNTNNPDKLYCQHCGKEIEKDNKFCKNCGEKIK